MNDDNDEQLCVAAVQPPLRHDTQHPLEATRNVVRMMRDAIISSNARIDLFVLPELCPLGYSEHTFQQYLHSDGMNEEIASTLAKFANEHNVFVCYGTVGKIWTNQSSDSSGRDRTETHEPGLSIRQVVVNDQGVEISAYDKMFLCDYGACTETRFFSPGAEPCSFECRGFRIGIIICADMRYPIPSRELAGRHRVDAIVQPAAFARDISFRTWKSFRETRAVENGVYFIGVNYSGENYGETSFNDPWIDEIHEPQLLGTMEGVLVGNISRSTLNTARKEMPFYRQLLRECKSMMISKARR